MKNLKDIEKDVPWLSIFRTVAFIGDSMASGEVVSRDENGSPQFNDFYEYSWGQFMARKFGFTAYNFSRGGMTCKEYLESFADRNRCFAPEKAAQAYFIALGLNDVNRGVKVGTAADSDDLDTLAGQYTKIIARYRAIQPRAVFFLVTMPRAYSDSADLRRKKEEHRAFLHEISSREKNLYVIDLFEYAPEHDETFMRRHYLNGHLTVAGYLLTAEQISRLANDIICQRIEEFRESGFIGTNLKA